MWCLECVCVAGVWILTLHVFFFTRRQQKDVALVNMANVLHRAHFSADAAILAHAALDLTSDLFTSHYTLGNIYAVRHNTPHIRLVSADHFVVRGR